MHSFFQDFQKERSGFLWLFYPNFPKKSDENRIVIVELQIL